MKIEKKLTFRHMYVHLLLDQSFSLFCTCRHYMYVFLIFLRLNWKEIQFTFKFDFNL